MLLHGSWDDTEADTVLLGRQETEAHRPLETMIQHRQGPMAQFPVADRRMGRAKSTKEVGATCAGMEYVCRRKTFKV